MTTHPSLLLPHAVACWRSVTCVSVVRDFRRNTSMFYLAPRTLAVTCQMFQLCGIFRRTTLTKYNSRLFPLCVICRHNTMTFYLVPSILAVTCQMSVRCRLFLRCVVCLRNTQMFYLVPSTLVVTCQMSVRFSRKLRYWEELTCNTERQSKECGHQ